MVDISEYQHMWDGAESGWQLVRYDTPVYLVEFHFDQTGPTDSERLAAAEFHAPIREDGRLIDGCPGFAIAAPISAPRISHLHQLQIEHQLELTIVEIAPGDCLVISPNGFHYCWLLSPGIEYRKPIVRKMLDAGLNVVDRHLD